MKKHRFKFPFSVLLSLLFAVAAWGSLKSSNEELSRLLKEKKIIESYNLLQENGDYWFLSSPVLKEELLEDYIDACFIILNADYIQTRNTSDDLLFKLRSISILGRILESSNLDKTRQELILGNVLSEVKRMRKQRDSIDSYIDGQQKQLKEKSEKRRKELKEEYEEYKKKLEEARQKGLPLDLDGEDRFFSGNAQTWFLQTNGENGLEGRRIVRKTYFKDYIGEVETELIPMVLKQAKEQSSMVYKYLQEAGYDRKEIPDLVSRVVGRDKSDEIFHKKRNKR